MQFIVEFFSIQCMHFDLIHHIYYLVLPTTSLHMDPFLFLVSVFPHEAENMINSFCFQFLSNFIHFPANDNFILPGISVYVSMEASSPTWVLFLRLCLLCFSRQTFSLAWNSLDWPASPTDLAYFCLSRGGITKHSIMPVFVVAVDLFKHRLR